MEAFSYEFSKIKEKLAATNQEYLLEKQKFNINE